MPAIPESIDDTALEREIGGRIREERIKRGMTQAVLAKRLGITAQQAHKYERGINRIAASRLIRIAQILGVEPSALLPIAGGAAAGPRGRLDLELARNFARLTSEPQRLSVCQLVRSLVPDGGPADTRETYGDLGGNGDIEVIRLRLFVSGATPIALRRSKRAIGEVRNLCEGLLAGRYSLEVVDIHQNPRAAQHDQIVAVPALVKMAPEPKQVLVGDMAEPTLTAWLGLSSPE